MFDLILANLLATILAMVIGLAIGWWIWGMSPSVEAHDEDYAEAEAGAFAPPEEPGMDAESDHAAGAPDIAPAVGESEDLTMINGIGPKLAALLQDLGVRRFDQIAAWSEREVAEVDAHLGSFRGRISRDQWIAQAGLLAKGELQQWKGRFGYKGK